MRLLQKGKSAKRLRAVVKAKQSKEGFNVAKQWKGDATSGGGRKESLFLLFFFN